ncbi:MAG: hypothetical protein D4R81_05595 [Nitrospiraceae bacterium]|nr:MAG: hypothetical protein D4R81_05595 [Nitrospiraceae bacterium]
MSHPATAISSVKLAWALSWAAFWTGFPFKAIVVLLLLAAQIHPWEGAGLIALLAVSVPIDIWALGLTARTFFLERMGIEVRGPVGIGLWWQGAFLGAVMLGIAYYAVGATVAVCKKAAAVTLGVVNKVIPIPVAEQITIELLMWAVPTTIVVIVLLLLWLKLFGWRIKRFVVASGQASSADLQERVREWDDWRVPADSILMLVSFTAVAVLLTVVFWVLLPVTTTHRHPDYPPPPTDAVKKKVKPEELLKKTDTALAKAEAVLELLEKEKAKEKKKPAGPGK